MTTRANKFIILSTSLQFFFALDFLKWLGITRPMHYLKHLVSTTTRETIYMCQGTEQGTAIHSKADNDQHTRRGTCQHKVKPTCVCSYLMSKAHFDYGCQSCSSFSLATCCLCSKIVVAKHLKLIDKIGSSMHKRGSLSNLLTLFNMAVYKLCCASTNLLMLYEEHGKTYVIGLTTGK